MCKDKEEFEDTKVVNQNPYMEYKHTTQWIKEKVQKDKHRSSKHTHKTKDRVKRTPLKSGDDLRCSGRVSSSCPTIGTFFARHRAIFISATVIVR